LLARLDDPGIVRYITHGVEGGSQYLVMEWVAGETLARRMQASGLTVDESVELTSQAAQALAVAHRHGVVHRDVKPDNFVFVRAPRMRVKLVDFGLARAGGDWPALTRSGVLLGTPGYMAPEQARGQRDIDARADVFALGCVLYECLTGRAAFEGGNQLALRTKILLGEPLPVADFCPEAPMRVVTLVERMLAKDRELRPADAGVVAAELATVAPIGATIRRATASNLAPTEAVEREPDERPGFAPGGIAAAALLCAVIAVPPEALGGTGGGGAEPPRRAARAERHRRAGAAVGAHRALPAAGPLAARRS